MGSGLGGWFDDAFLRGSGRINGIGYSRAVYTLKMMNCVDESAVLAGKK